MIITRVTSGDLGISKAIHYAQSLLRSQIFGFTILVEVYLDIRRCI
jgi:hypothetical protein